MPTSKRNLVKKWLKIRLSVRKPVSAMLSTTVFLSPFLFIFILPLSASAGIFSVIVGLFQAEGNGDTTEAQYSLQNMPLLQGASNPDPNPAKGGGDITIVSDSALLPDYGPSGTLSDIEAEPQSYSISVYIVRKGDSISQIAKMFGVSVNTIIWGNNLKSSIIKEGDRLVILPVNGVKHIVQSGDTLTSIAKKYKADAVEISRFNDIVNNTLIPGQTIIVPDGEVSQVNITSVSKGSGPTYEGYYMRPLNGGRKTQGIHGYNGVDFGAPIGTSVFASAAGNVIISRNYGWNGGYGKYIVISHGNGTQTLYAHLNDNLVFEGAYVAKGDMIGFVGTSGKSTGPHLHFEVRGAKNPF